MSGFAAWREVSFVYPFLSASYSRSSQSRSLHFESIVITDQNASFMLSQFVHILFPSLFLDGFAVIFPSGILGFILAGISLGLKLALYFSSKRVLLEKGGEAVNGFASLDPRRAVQTFQSSGGGWSAGNPGGQTLGSAEQGSNQTSESGDSYRWIRFQRPSR